MERYHKSYRIISRSDRDPENNLFRALITIETSPVLSTAKIQRHVANQQRDDSRTNEAESYGVEWGIEQLTRVLWKLAFPADYHEVIRPSGHWLPCSTSS